MISLGQPSDPHSPTLHRFVYVVALAPRDTPDMVEFLSTEVSASDEDDAYLLGISSDSIVIPEDYVVLNDYVHKIGGNK
jgi:hypothetical protein